MTTARKKVNCKNPNFMFLRLTGREEVKVAKLTGFMWIMCLRLWWGPWRGLQRSAIPEWTAERTHLIASVKLANSLRLHKEEEYNKPLLSLWYSGQIQKIALHPSPFLFRFRLCSRRLHPPDSQVAEMIRETQGQPKIYLFLNSDSSMTILWTRP